MPRGTKAEPSKLTIEIAKTIRGELARQQMDKTTLATTTGISLPQISKIVAGKKQFDIEQLDVILIALGMDLTEVVKAADNATQSRLIAP